MNIGVHVSFQIRVFIFSGYMSRSGVAGSYGNSIFILFIYFKILFIYLLAACVFVAVRRLSLVAASGSYSSLWCTGFSLRWLLLLQSMGSRRMGFSSCGSRAVEHRLSSCDVRVSLLHGMWDLPGPGPNLCPLHWQTDS